MIRWLFNLWARRVDARRALVLGAFSVDECSGAEIMRRTGLSSGTVYPILYWAEDKGLLVSRIADGPYPRRTLYRKAP